MDTRLTDIPRLYWVLAVAAVLALVAAAFVVADPLAPGAYERATVTVVDEDGTELGTVRVRVADTFQQHYTGLSDTEALSEDEGMLFVFEGEARRSFVMREMDFPLDIVFVGANRTVTRIHHAPVPPPNASGSDLAPYRGTGQFVLEVNRGWTTRHNVTTGDRIRIRGYSVSNVSSRLRSRWFDHAELLHEAEHVRLDPPFGDFPVLDSGEHHVLNFERPARGLDAHQFAFGNHVP